MAFIFILSLAYLGANLVIYNQMILTFNTLGKTEKIISGILYWTMTLSFFIPFVVKSGNIVLMKTASTIGGLWLIGTLYMTILLLVCKLLKLFIRSFKHGFFISATITILILTYGYINNIHIHRQYIDIATDKKMDRPLKIVAVSDIHLGYLTGQKHCKKIVETINSEKADLILIAGDLIDSNIEPVKNAHMEDELQKLDANYGVYMVPGNHDHHSGIENCHKFAEAAGITLLTDSIVVIDKQIQIIGRDDYSNRLRKEIETLISKIDTNILTIVIDHQPWQLKRVSELPIDLQISGHTHNGQIFPLNLIIKHLYEQGYGYRKWDKDSHIYVSSGISLWGPPVRIGTVNEMAVFRIGSTHETSHNS